MKILILGESGSGKTASLRNLPTQSTAYLSPIACDTYAEYIIKATCKSMQVLKASLQKLSERDYIKTIIIDDFQYFLSDAFFKKALVKGYEKYTELAKDAWEILDLVDSMADKQDFIFVAHTELQANGVQKMKTVGKLFDNQGDPEGRFANKIYAVQIDNQYKFLLKSDGARMPKTSKILEQECMDNDIVEFIKIIKGQANDQ